MNQLNTEININGVYHQIHIVEHAPISENYSRFEFYYQSRSKRINEEISARNIWNALSKVADRIEKATCAPIAPPPPIRPQDVEYWEGRS